LNTGSTHYWFDATSITIDLQQKNFLDIGGNGMAFETRYDLTSGAWSITETGGRATVTFGSAAAVPDGGATALLIALGLAGVAAGLAAQRRLTRS
jgi:hypothetical protein